MVQKPENEDLSEEEAERRFKAALGKALSTPPKPQKDLAKRRPKKSARPQK